jgi:hypothetical protein
VRPPALLATLAALCALAAPAALAPTPASAVINNQSTSGCAAPHPGDQVFWNGNTWCQLQEGQGGAPSSAPGASPLDPHFWASSDAPKDPVVECLRQNAGTCMPVQRGGPGSRGVLEGKEGPIAGSGSKAAGKSETGRGKKAEKSKGAQSLAVKKCLELEKKEVGVWKPPTNLDEVRRQQSDHTNVLQRLTTQLNDGRADGSIDGEEQVILEGRIRFERLKIDELQYQLDVKKRWDAKLEAWKKKCAPVLDVK